MICLVRWLIVTTASAVALLALASAHAGPTSAGEGVLAPLPLVDRTGIAAQDRGWDTDIGCCFLYDDFRKGGEYERAFAILLVDMDRHIFEMRLTTPTGTVLGFDTKTRRYSKPNNEGAYGLLISTGISLSHLANGEWLGRTERIFVLRPQKGQYRLQVIARHAGNYTIKIYPRGWPQPVPGPDSDFFDAGTGLVPIKAGETHTYVFPGEFDNTSPRSTDHFYWKQVK